MYCLIISAKDAVISTMLMMGINQAFDSLSMGPMIAKLGQIPLIWSIEISEGKIPWELEYKMIPLYRRASLRYSTPHASSNKK